jgi:mannosyltransferase
VALRIVRRITGRGKVAAVRGVGVISVGTAAPGAEHPAPLRRRLSDWAVLIIPAAAALLLDGYQLGKLSLWRDEAYTVDAAHRGIGQIIALLHRTDAVNGAYYLLMHGVITFFGTSAAVLRLPSLLATAVTAAMIAALGRLLARQANLPAPWLTGLLAGLLFAAAPQAIRYAQDARAYAIVTMLATVATYLLVRAMMVGTWWRWTGYALAIAAAGLFNLFSLLLVVAHGLTVLTARARRRRVAPDVAAVPLSRWLVAAIAAGIALAPLTAIGASQRRQIAWLPKPDWGTAYDLVVSFCGGRPLVVLILVLALCGSVAGLITRSRFQATRGPATPGVVGLPWLLVPPVVLLTASQDTPVYNGRYVVYCLPALALLCATGLAAAASGVSGALPRGSGAVAGWLPSAGVATVLAVLLIAPQQAIRLPASRPDNLRAAAAAVTAHGRSTDIVFYIPWNQRILGMGYPGPFRRLRDIALAVSPVASSTLLGTEVSLATWRHRLLDVSRIWLVTSVSHRKLLESADPLDRVELALLSSMRLIGRWHAGSDVLSLYGQRKAR